MRKIYFAILCVAAAMTSCSKSDPTVDGGSSAQMISVDPMIQSRATELNFESGDQIGLSVVMEEDKSVYLENQMLEYNGTNFVSADLLWYIGDLPSTFTAYYPYAEGDALPTSFTVQADQTVDGAYTASDLMTATVSEVKPSIEAVNMLFSHKLSRIIIDAKSVENITSVTVGSVYPAATIDVKTGNVGIDTSVEAIDIKAPLWDDGKYKAIIVPQSASLKFTVTFEDGSVESVEAGFMSYAAGKEHTASLTFVGDELSISVSGDVDGWEDGGSIVEPGSYEEFDDHFVYDGETYNFATIGGVTIMTDNLRYIPEGMTVSADPADGSGLWYPCSHSTNADGATVATAVTDSPELGYLYNFKTAMCGAEYNSSNYKTFEGAQGICPKGWHIPTFDDWFALSGQALGTADNTEAPFYDADGDAYGATYSSIKEANAAGFDFTFSGTVIAGKYNTTSVKDTYTSTTATPAEKNVGDASFAGKPAIAYYMSSTGKTATMLWSMMTSFTYSFVDGKFYQISGQVTAGQNVRCVKDSDARQ